jgi:ParB family chromosome partitioning protein
MDDSFSNAVDETLRGNYVRVHSEVGVFEGWAGRTDPDRGSVVLHDAANTTTEESIGSVFLPTCTAVEVLRPTKRIEFCAVDDLNPHPEYELTEPPTAETIRQAYRNQFPGAFPVVRENGTMITGHKQVAAAEVAGLSRIPVEMIAVDDEQAAELFRIAHGDDTREASESGESESDASERIESDDTEAESETTDDDAEGPVYGYDI